MRRVVIATALLACLPVRDAQADDAAALSELIDDRIQRRLDAGGLKPVRQV